MRTTRATAWVVYQAAVKGMDVGPRAVCDQAEWDAMEAATPGVNRLIRGGLTNEAEAERLARGTSGDSAPRGAAAPAAAGAATDRHPPAGWLSRPVRRLA